MKQKIVINVDMHSAKCRSKAMQIAVQEDGVNSVEIEGAYKDKMVVIGDEVDSVNLARSLQKKFSHASIVSVEVLKTKEGEGKENRKDKNLVVPCYLSCYQPCPPQYYYMARPVYDQDPPNCSVM